MPTTVIGIMVPGFSFPFGEDLWIPLAPTRSSNERGAHNLGFVLGHLAPGATIESASAEMAIIGRRLASAYPLTNQGVAPLVQNFTQYWIGATGTLIYKSMWGAVAFVLLIACANLANLTLGRTIRRAREISLRIALGASRGRIVRQLLFQSLMLSAAGGFLGWWIARSGVRAYIVLEFSGFQPAWAQFKMDDQAVAYLVTISAVAGLLFGLAPAARISRIEVNSVLQDGGRGATGGLRGKRLSRVLVLGEMALALVLLAGAGAMIHSFLNIYNASIGVNAKNILTTYLVLPESRYASADERISFFNRLDGRVNAIPGVESVALADHIPTGGADHFPYEFDGSRNADRRATLLAVTISPAYFRFFGVPIVSGRGFNDFDAASGASVVIVNERFATAHWAGQNPLGKRLRLFHGQQPQPWMTVVGVVPNIDQDFKRQQIDPLIYLPYAQNSMSNMFIIARTRVPPASLMNAFRREVQILDPDIATVSYALDEELASINRQIGGNLAILFLSFATIALLLASTGLYAVVAQSVAERTQEIGIRMTVGAMPIDILNLVFRQGMLPLGVGLGIGLAGSLFVMRLLKSALVHVSPTDPITLTVASMALILSAALGCWIPARRAMRVDPVIALRNE